MSFIFISYSRQDQAYVSTLVQALNARGLPVWLDDQIDYGTTWPRVIQEHLEQCQAFLLIMSPCSYDSHWVQCELSLALELKKPIFPLLLEGTRWLSVAAIQMVDVKNGALPPDRLFDKVRKCFTALEVDAAATASTISIQDVVAEQLPVVPLPPIPPRTAKNIPLPMLPSFEDPRMEGRIAGEKKLHPILQPQFHYMGNVLPSEKGIDYTKLRDLLKAQDWRAADQETYETMLRAVGKQSGDGFTSEELFNFPYADLKTIDELWVKYSNGCFGFSVQKQIYVECGGELNGKHPGAGIWEEFGDRIGWRRNGNWLDRDNLKPPLSFARGIFPYWFFWFFPSLSWFVGGWEVEVLALGVGCSLLSHPDL